MVNVINILSIRAKLMLIVMITTVFCLVVASVTFIVYYSDYSKQLLVKDISTTAKLFANGSAATIVFRDYNNAKENLMALTIKSSVDAACLLDDKGDLFATYITTSAKKFVFPIGCSNSGYKFENGRLMLFEPVMFEKKQIGTIFMSANLKELHRLQYNLILFVSIIIIVLSIAAFFISLRLQLLISKPLINLTNTALRVAATNDYSLRATRTSNDETGVLTSAFNEMLEMIDTQNTERRELIRNLRDSTTMLNTVLDAVPQSIFWKDTQSVYLGCNKAFANLVGLSTPQFIVGKTDFNLPWSAQETTAYLNDDKAVIRSNTPKIHIIEPIHQIDGKEHWIDTTKIPLANEAVYF